MESTVPPPAIDPPAAQLFQPLPVRDGNRPLDAFERVRQERMAQAPPAAPVALRNVPPPPRPAAPPARIEIAGQDPIAQRDRVPERLFHLLNETRGRTEFAALARRIEIARAFAPREGAAAGGIPGEAEVPVVRFAGEEPAPPPGAALPAPARPAAGPIRELDELSAGAGPGRAGILLAAETNQDLVAVRARDIFAEEGRAQAPRREAGIGAPGVTPTLIDQTV